MKERANSRLRFLDRYLGIAFILVFSLFKKKRKWPNKIHSIALLKSAGIGDTILLSAVIRDLKKERPTIDIYLFTGIANREAALLIPGIKSISLPMTNPWKSLKIIRKYPIDLWIDCDPWPRINALLSFFSISKFTLGFKTKGQLRHFLFDAAISHGFNCHELDNYRKFLRPLGIEPVSLPQISFSKKKGQASCKVALHIFAGGSRAYLKEWPIESWKELINFLLAEKFEVILTGSQRDYPALQNYFGSPSVVNVAGRLSLIETAKLLETCACVISVDTGIMHLASALNVAVIALHGPTSPKRWGGLGENVFAVTPHLDYSPCIQLGFEKRCSRNLCMQSISVDQVKKRLRQVFLQKEYQHDHSDLGRRQRHTPVAPFQE